MTANPLSAAFIQEVIGWRRDLHRHPEVGFKETRTATFVAARLREMGIDDVVEGVGGTGVVGTLKRGSGNRSIALRADMDALMIAETTGVDHQSQNPGVMHACGHDGHTSMLLGAAKRLVESGDFDGTVRFLFQPAEEWGKGAIAMLDDGLLERFPFEEIHGLHNLPSLEVGQFRARPGATMSAEDNFEIVLRGQGGHAARPHSTHETMVAACALVVALQAIVARKTSPTDVAVVSVTELITDGTRNALPGQSRILGDARSFKPKVSAEIERQMRLMAEGTAMTYGVEAEVVYTREFVPLLNDGALFEEAMAAAGPVFGDGAAQLSEPQTGSEDFARFLEKVPGCFVFIGNGKSSAPLHSSAYDFNDDALEYGIGYFESLVRRRLPVSA